MTPHTNRRYSLAAVWILAILLVVLAFKFQAHVGVDLADEGYLWYGAWRVSHGEVPRLDFRSYEPLRNYWVAFGSVLFGDGPIGMRAAVAVAQALGLALGLLVVRRIFRPTWWLPSAVLLLVWMFPRHKYFDIAIAIAAVYVVVLLLEEPSTKRAFWGGFFVGLAGAFRLNHGLYTSVALSAAILLCFDKKGSWKNLMKPFVHFGAGVLAGLFPIWILMAVYPGLFASYVDLILVILQHGKTNQPLGIPWPWLVEIGKQRTLYTLQHLGVGVAYVMVFVFFALAVIRLWKTRGQSSPQRNVLLAATLVGLPYTHHAIVRSDVSHLCQAIHPLLLGSLAFIAFAIHGRRRIEIGVTAILLATLTLAVPLLAQPGVVRLCNREAFVQQDLAGDRIWVHQPKAQLIQATRSLLAKESAPDDLIFFAPMSAALYRIVERPVPVWDPYPIWPPAPDAARQMIEDLKKPQVKWAVVGSEAVSGDHFWDTHPQVWEYLQSSFERLELDTFPESVTVFRKSPSGGDKR